MSIHWNIYHILYKALLCKFLICEEENAIWGSSNNFQFYSIKFKSFGSSERDGARWLVAGVEEFTQGSLLKRSNGFVIDTTLALRRQMNKYILLTLHVIVE